MNMSTQLLYNDFPTFLRKYFPYKVQKISLNAGFTCPNRDGTKGWGGCTYCNNQTFNPDYCRTEKSIAIQLEEGKCFFAHKYPEMKYLAYFQAYTNTYAELEGLKRKYEEALAVDGVVGLVIGTRPDCMPESLLRYLEDLNKHTFLMVEYGIESTCDETLKRINRGHTYADTVEAVCQTAACGILTGGHIILGLPGETHDTMVAHAEILSDLPLATLKIHQLQLIRGTRMAHEYDVTPAGFHLFNEVEEYIDLVIDYVEHLRPDMVVERFVSQSPKDLLIAPDWGLKNYEFVARLQKRMKERGDNELDIKERLRIETIGYDKVNQLRHVRFFKNLEGVKKQMKLHADILRPKFLLVDQILTMELGDNYGTWTKPHGGYFISFNTLPNLAKKVVKECKALGVQLTEAGATYPYHHDELDTNIRIAPSYPSLDELNLATHVFTTVVKKETIKKLIKEKKEELKN